MGLRYQENSSSQQSSLGLSRTEEKVMAASSVNENILGRGPNDSPANSSGLSRSRSEKDPIGRYRPNNRVAIFRDQKVDRKDPDYDRNYDRYMQRFDPGFGFSGGPCPVQPLYVPALNYNTEFPQIGPTLGPQRSGLPFVNPPERVQPFTQSHLLPQTDEVFGLAQPR